MEPMRNYTRTTIQLEILTDAPFQPESLDEVAQAIQEGTASVGWSVASIEQVDPQEAARILYERNQADMLGLVVDDYGSFLAIEDEEGNRYDASGNILEPVGLSELIERRDAAVKLGLAGPETNLGKFLRKGEYRAREYGEPLQEVGPVGAPEDTRGPLSFGAFESLQEEGRLQNGT